jgi:hypothetical protein
LVKGAEYDGLITFGHLRLPFLVRDGYISGELFTFAFCRNPYDRAVSLWAHHRRDYDPDISFLDFCRGLPEMDWRYSRPQVFWTKWTRLNFLGRFENLQADFDRLCDQLELDRRTLPHLNATEHGPCNTYYSDESQELIRTQYRQDFERFGYADNHLPD